MSRYYGIEVELENVSNALWDRSMAYWAMDGDGSLRNHGAEFRFRKPFELKHVMPALEELSGHLSEFPDVDASHRCGVHIHMDARDMSNKEIGRLMLNYMMIEPTLFASLQGDRVSNNFCVPYFHSMDVARTLYRTFHDWDSENLGTVASKYAALNAASYLQIQTLEWRMFPAVLPVTDIEKWVNMVDDIKVTSVEKVMTEVEAVDFCLTHFGRATETEMDMGYGMLHYAQIQDVPRRFRTPGPTPAQMRELLDGQPPPVRIREIFEGIDFGSIDDEPEQQDDNWEEE